MAWILVAAAVWLPIAIVAALLVGRSLRLVDPASQELSRTGAEESFSTFGVDDDLIRVLLEEASIQERRRSVHPSGPKSAALHPSSELDPSDG